jgi:hypothetical protein
MYSIYKRMSGIMWKPSLSEDRRREVYKQARFGALVAKSALKHAEAREKAEKEDKWEEDYKEATRSLKQDKWEHYPPGMKEEFERIVMDYETYEGPITNYRVDIDRYFNPYFDKAEKEYEEGLSNKKEFHKTIAKLQNRKDKVQKKYDSIECKVGAKIYKLKKEREAMVDKGISLHIEIDAELVDVGESLNAKKKIYLQDDWIKHEKHKHADHDCDELGCED